MAESDSETQYNIEYLEEDAEIVKQCVQITQLQLEESRAALLVELPRTSVDRKKRRKEDDSDYDPSEEQVVIKKRVTQRKPKLQIQTPTFQNKNIRQSKLLESKQQRKNIRIPDYDDPLCLPVRANRSYENDLKRLNNWNDVCLERFKYCDELLKPERGATVKTVRTAVFKNVVNKTTGSVETTIWSKSSVENEDGDVKSEIFQCVLPRYKEKKVVNNYILSNKKLKTAGLQNEVVLTKEEHKDGEALIVYKPKESLSAVYGLIDKRNKENEEETTQDEESTSKMYLRELTCCKMCAACYQGSWRCSKKQNKTRTLVCPVCARTYISIYNLLSHFKTHSATELKRYQKIISVILADIVGYHYNCRICSMKFESIKALRKHTLSHQSNEEFTCEVCNREVNTRK